MKSFFHKNLKLIVLGVFILVSSSPISGQETGNLDGYSYTSSDFVESFNNFIPEKTDSNSGNFTGVQGNLWEYRDLNITETTNGTALVLGKTVLSSLKSTMVGGITEFSFDYIQFSETDVNLEVLINNKRVTTVTSSAEAGTIKNSGTIKVPDVNGIFTIEFKQVPGSGPVAIDNFSWNKGPNIGYVYSGGKWSPHSPEGISTGNDDIMVVDGVVDISSNLQVNNLFVHNGATVNIEGILTISGDIENQGSVVFVGNANKTGQLGAVPSTSKVNGDFTVQQYIAPRRGFRFLTSSVTTDTSIHANWQEGARDANDDPNPGYGMHITGSPTGDAGFDATPTGNPSLFTLNNASQSWEHIENADKSTLVAGKPYRVFVRGDRSIDVGSNNAAPTSTVLRAQGKLLTGRQTFTDFSKFANDFNFFGNPYQATVDMKAVIASSENINPNFYYVWDPQLNGRGAYVAVDLNSGSNCCMSEMNGYLQPGQAAFVTTLSNGPASLVFEESHKATRKNSNEPSKPKTILDLRMYEAASFAANCMPLDGLRIKFDEEGSNALTSKDAPKFYNQDENLATRHGPRLFSIESRAMPQIEERIALYTDQYRYTDYVLEADLTGLKGVTAYLRDTYTGLETVLVNNEVTIYPFSVEKGNAASTTDDRFELFFAKETLNNSDLTFGDGFVVFPNPVYEQTFYIATRGLTGKSVSISLKNMLGQEVVAQSQTIGTSGRLDVTLPRLPSGIYTVVLNAGEGKQFTTKLINR